MDTAVSGRQDQAHECGVTLTKVDQCAYGRPMQAQPEAIVHPGDPAQPGKCLAANRNHWVRQVREGCVRRNVQQAGGVGGGEARAAAGWQGRETQSQTWGSDWTERQEGVQHRRSAQPGRGRLGAGDREGSNQREAGAREDTETDAQAQGAEQHAGTGMITRGRKRTEGEGDLNRKRLRDQAKRAKDTSKRARRAENRGPAHQGDATGATIATVAVTQTKKGEELTSRKNKEGRNADSTKRGKNGQAEWEETNEEVT